VLLKEPMSLIAANGQRVNNSCCRSTEREKVTIINTSNEKEFQVISSHEKVIKSKAIMPSLLMKIRFNNKLLVSKQPLHV